VLFTRSFAQHGRSPVPRCRSTREPQIEFVVDAKHLVASASSLRRKMGIELAEELRDSIPDSPKRFALAGT
jgi:hypothetical protein